MLDWIQTPKQTETRIHFIPYHFCA